MISVIQHGTNMIVTEKKEVTLTVSLLNNFITKPLLYRLEHTVS